MQSMNAYKIDGTAQNTYEETQLNEAYASQGTAQGSFISIPVILARAQRDLQEHYRGQTPN
jgi:hypothetical protein